MAIDKSSEFVETYLSIQLESVYFLGDLNAGLAHELNNPLSVIMGQIELIKILHSVGKLDEQSLLEKLDKLITASERMGYLIQNMNKLPRSTTKKEAKAFEVKVLLDDLYYFANYPCRKNKIALKYDASLKKSATIYGKWDEIFTSLHFVIAELILLQVNLEERFLKISAETTKDRVNIRFHYPKVEYQHKNGQQVCNYVCQKYQGEVGWENGLINIQFPLFSS